MAGVRSHLCLTGYRRRRDSARRIRLSGPRPTDTRSWVPTRSWTGASRARRRRAGGGSTRSWPRCCAGAACGTWSATSAGWKAGMRPMSFMLGCTPYILQAKWQHAPVDAGARSKIKERLEGRPPVSVPFCCPCPASPQRCATGRTSMRVPRPPRPGALHAAGPPHRTRPGRHVVRQRGIVPRSQVLRAHQCDAAAQTPRHRTQVRGSGACCRWPRTAKDPGPPARLGSGLTPPLTSRRVPCTPTRSAAPRCCGPSGVPPSRSRGRRPGRRSVPSGCACPDRSR